MWNDDVPQGRALHEEHGPPVSEVPSISICIPTYNRAPRLATVLAKFTQVLRTSAYVSRLELVISNNASTDGTGEIIQSALEGLSERCRVRVYTQRDNLGAEGNFKFLYENARGGYVWLWGDDDALNGAQFDVLLHDLEQHRPEVCISTFSNFGSGASGGRRGANPDDVSIVTSLREAIEQVSPLGKVCQYVIRRHELTEEEQIFSDRAARETSFWHVAISVLLLVRREARLLVRAAEIGSSDKSSWDMRFSPRVYGTKRPAVLMMLEGHPLRAHFERWIPVEPIDNLVVGNLFRTCVGMSQLSVKVATEEYAYMMSNLRAIAFSNLRNAVKVPFILTLYPLVRWLRGGPSEG